MVEVIQQRLTVWGLVFESCRQNYNVSSSFTNLALFLYRSVFIIFDFSACIGITVAVPPTGTRHTIRKGKDFRLENTHKERHHESQCVYMF